MALLWNVDYAPSYGYWSNRCGRGLALFRHIILDYIERQLTLAEAEVERYHYKHGQDFDGWSKSLSGQATIEDEDEWMEWEAALDVLQGWQQIRTEIEQSRV